MHNLKDNKKKDVFLFVYILIIGLFTVIGNKVADSFNKVGNHYIVTAILLSIFIYICLLTLPVIELKIVQKIDLLEYLKLKKNKIRGIKIGIGCSALLIVLSFIKIFVFKRNNVSAGISFETALFVLFVGFFEEIPFRGFILQRFQERYKFWKANIITSFVFAIIHIPNWSIKGIGIAAALYSTFVISLFFGYIFNKSKSLFSVIILHSMYNLMMLFIS